jgi:hypothetical protein
MAYYIKIYFQQHSHIILPLDYSSPCTATEPLGLLLEQPGPLEVSEHKHLN